MRRFVVATTLSFLALAANASPALAHDRRTVGPYQLVVGFLNEPAFTGEPNAVDLRVSDATSNQPVEGLQDTLRVEIIAGGQTRTLKLRALGQPGAYAADFVPTVTTTYVFNFIGKIGERTIDERFESGPGRFEEPEDATAARLPVTDPLGDLAGQLDQTRALAIAAVILSIAVPIGLRFWRRT